MRIIHIHEWFYDAESSKGITVAIFHCASECGYRFLSYEKISYLDSPRRPSKTRAYNKSRAELRARPEFMAAFSLNQSGLFMRS